MNKKGIFDIFQLFLIEIIIGIIIIILLWKYSSWFQNLSGSSKITLAIITLFAVGFLSIMRQNWMVNRSR